MKVIISHDVDHLTVTEHLLKDLIVPKFLIRSKIELLKGKIGFYEYLTRLKELFGNQWNRVNEVMDYNDSLGIKSTFFFGMGNDLGLSYSSEAAVPFITNVISRGFEAGVHGIAYDNKTEMEREFNLFRRLSGLEKFGIRMHYLRHNDTTIHKMDECGYLYDATLSEFKDPYRIGNLYEFPLQIMDGWIMDGESRWQTRNFPQACDYTKQLIDKAVESNLNVLSILFHDRYFTPGFSTWMKWYMWVIDYCKSNGFTFSTHKGWIESQEKE